MAAPAYSKEEISALRGFCPLRPRRHGRDLVRGPREPLTEDRPQAGGRARAHRALRRDRADDRRLRKVSGARKAGQPDQPGEEPDPKVLEFLRILEQYRRKCEKEGNYLEADRAHQQLEMLRKQEEKRQQKAVRARQIAERQDVQIAHNMQYTDFNASWDKYLAEYDRMAQIYIQQMTERHATNLLEFQRKLQSEMAERPPKWSRELLEWRRRQHMLARQKNYAEAQRIKKIADKLEDKERKSCENMSGGAFSRKDGQFRNQQQAELQALLKRIDARRKEHLKQRTLDSKRLLQRNRNVQAVLESKQAAESSATFMEIRKNLMQSTTQVARGPTPPSLPISLKALARQWETSKLPILERRPDARVVTLGFASTAQSSQGSAGAVRRRFAFSGEMRIESAARAAVVSPSAASSAASVWTPVSVFPLTTHVG